MKRCLVAVLFLFCIGCSESQIHRVKLANADLAAALNRATITVLNLAQQGSLDASERAAVLSRFSDATLVSDGIAGCTNAVTARDTLRGCVAPLLVTLRDDIDAATIGIKSGLARTTMRAILDGLLVNVNQIAEVR